jgi:hypothetical protein
MRSAAADPKLARILQATYDRLTGQVLYVIDPEDGSDDVVLVAGKNSARISRTELVEILGGGPGC